MDLQNQIWKGIIEVKGCLQCVQSSSEELKRYVMTNIPGWKENKFHDVVENFHIYFNENDIRVVKVVLINYTSKRPYSAMEGSAYEHTEEKYKSEAFSNVVRAILFRKM